LFGNGHQNSLEEMAEIPVTTPSGTIGPWLGPSELSLFDRMRLVLVDFKTITCEKCGRVWREPLLEKVFKNAYGETRMAAIAGTVMWCSHCSPAKRRPAEGDTFHPKRRMGRGKLVTPRRQQPDDDARSDADWFDHLAHEKSWYYEDLAERNRISRMETQEGDNLLLKKNLARAREFVRRLTLGQLEQRFPWLTRHEVRMGKAGILATAAI
jgi:hypothetical protein